MDDFSFSENQLNTQAYEYMRENLLKEKERRILKQNEMENELKNMETKDKHLNDEINIEIERLDELIESIKLKSEVLPSNDGNLSNLENSFNLNERPVSDAFIDMINSKDTKIEFCFLVSCTDSMLPYLDEIKDFTKYISRKLKLFFDEIKLSFIGYRDHDSAERITMLPFVKDINRFQNFISKVKCEKSEDECDDVFGGLEEVVNLKWDFNSRKILFHVGDRPCHGKIYHEKYLDFYPEGDPRKLDISNFIEKLTILNIQYYFCAINSSTYKMIDEFNKKLAIAKGESIKVLRYGSIKDFVLLTDKYVLKKVMTNDNKNKIKETKNAHIDQNAFSWSISDLKKFKATHITGIFHGNLNKLNDFTISYRYNDIDIWIADNPFTNGSLRYAYAGLINIGSAKDEVNLKCVFKESISNSPAFRCLQFHQDMIEIQKLARYLAHEFNKISKTHEKIKVIDVDIILINNRESFYTVEQFEEGDFKKWTNNAGGINKSIYVCLLHAFSHWTYQVTNNYLMVTDLQGFQFKNKEYILTDPSITCPSDLEKFSSTNLGEKGLMAFFNAHRCNSFCRKLKLKKNEYQSLDDLLI